METLAGFPFTRLELDKDGERVGGAAPLVPPGTTDLIVLSHGWKNAELDAIALYSGILSGATVAADGAMAAGGRKFAALGVFWPAFWFRKDLSLVPDNLGQDDIAGGAAALATTSVDAQALRKAASEMADELGLGPAFADAAEAAAGGGGAADAFLVELRSALSKPASPEEKAEHRELLRDPGSELVDALSQGARLQTEQGDYRAQGSGAGVGRSIIEKGWRLLSGGKSAVATILNQASYFEMKARAGTVGGSLAKLLDELPNDVRVHLIGHSFGARVVTAACAKLQKVKPKSLTLLQAAYSHNGLGLNIGPRRIEGGFRRIIKEKLVTGPIVITHTRRDTAVGFFYAVASAASGEIAKGATVIEKLIGGPGDQHGGMGANGAQSMKAGEVVTLAAAPGSSLGLSQGQVNNVLADSIITGHNDVANREVGRLVWQALK